MHGSLADLEVAFLYLDAIALRVRMDKRVMSVPVLVALAVLADGQKQLVALEMCGSESYEAWKGFLDSLVERVQKGGLKEVIMATNPTLEGDGTALFISNLLAPTGVRVTRLARGLPSGSVLEFANSQMLADALEGRRTF